MNNPSPLIPQGSLLEQKNKSRSRVKLLFFCTVGAHVVGLMVLLFLGCRREQPQPPPEAELPVMTDTNLPPMDTNLAPEPITSNAPTIPPPPIDMTATSPVTPTTQEYVIQKGDSFYTIGKKLHVPMKAIQEANPNVNPSRLQIGQKIVIPAVTAPSAPVGAAPGVPAPAVPAGGDQPYVVKSGDTLTKIAKAHGTTVKALRSANNLATDRIKVGDKLIIPAKAEVTPPAPVEPAPIVPVVPPPAPTPAPPGQ